MIKIFLDSSDIEEIKNFKDKVDGFTTNPSLMKKAGVKDYESWAKKVLEIVKDKPVSFEVIADDFDEMERQARIISSWGKNIYVKIPITNTLGVITGNLIDKLSKDGIKINVTAIMRRDQLQFLSQAVAPMILSFFAGRIADTGIDPRNIFRPSIYNMETLWASPREVLNIYQAEQAGADIITCTPELIKKYEKFKGMDLNVLSLMTVKQFYEDAKESGLKL